MDWKLVASIVALSTLIALSMIFLGIGSGDVGGLVPR